MSNTLGANLIRIPGWYPSDAKDRRKDAPPDRPESSSRIGTSYVWSIREFRIDQLEVTDIKKYQGHFFNPVAVRAIIDITSSSLVKFFILEEHVEDLKWTVEKARGSNILLGSPFRYI